MDNLFLIAAVAISSWFYTKFQRVESIRGYEIENANYPIEAGIMPWLRDSYNLKSHPTRFHAFVSFKRDPDEEYAGELAIALKKKGLEIAIINNRLEPSELVRNVGNDVGIRLHLDHRLFQSFGVVLVASKKTFTSYWTSHEFTAAMMFSNAVIVVLVDNSVPDDILPNKSWPFRKLVTAPVYVVDGYGNISEIIDRVGGVLRLASLGEVRTKLDLWTAVIIAVLSLVFIFGVFLATGEMVSLMKFPEMLIYITISLATSLIMPCRLRIPREEFIRAGFKPVLKGWNADIYRINGFFSFLLVF